MRKLEVWLTILLMIIAYPQISYAENLETEDVDSVEEALVDNKPEETLQEVELKIDNQNVYEGMTASYEQGMYQRLRMIH